MNNHAAAQLDELLTASDNNNGLVMITHDDSKSDSNSSDTFRFELDKNYSIQLDDVKQTANITATSNIDVSVISTAYHQKEPECEHKTPTTTTTTTSPRTLINSNESEF